MTTARRVLLSALFLLGIGAMAYPAEQHHLQVMGRPQIFDVIPPTVPYVEVYATTFTGSPDTINGTMNQMYGGCTQVTRLTREEAQALVDQLSMWLLDPAEEMLLFEKRIVPNPSFNRISNALGETKRKPASR